MKLLIFLVHCIASQVPERENFDKNVAEEKINGLLSFCTDFLEPNASNSRVGVILYNPVYTFDY